jgi:hypothetical protein
MATLTIELSDAIMQQAQERKISPQRLESLIVQFVELYLEETVPGSRNTHSTWSDPTEFAKRIIANNRELFEELAHLP